MHYGYSMPTIIKWLIFYSQVFSELFPLLKAIVHYDQQLYDVNHGFIHVQYMYFKLYVYSHELQ